LEVEKLETLLTSSVADRRENRHATPWSTGKPNWSATSRRTKVWGKNSWLV